LSNYLNKMEQIIKKFENSIIKKKKWSNNGWRGALVNNIIFEIHV
jgi:hypothetical protein